MYIYKLNLVILSFIRYCYIQHDDFFLVLETRLCMLDKHFTIGTVLHIDILREKTIKYVLLPPYVVRTII